MTKIRSASGGQPSISHLIVVIRLLWRCFFSVFAVVVGTFVLAAVPQAREALTVFAADASIKPLRATFFVIAVLYWATAAWLSSRLLLGRRFDRDTLGASPDDPFVDWFATVLPRGLAFLAMLPLCAMTWQADRTLGAFMLAAAILFMVFVVLRRRFGDLDSFTHKSYAEFDLLGQGSRQACLGLMAFGFALFGSLTHRELGMLVAAAWTLAVLALWAWDSRGRRNPLPFSSTDALVLGLSLLGALGMLTMGALLSNEDEIDIARRVGSPAILLCALASWTLFGGLILTYLPLSLRWVTLAPFLPPVLLVVGSLYETHWVAQRELKAPLTDQAWRSNRKDVSDRFSKWMERHEPGEPTYMIAVVGGASRAGFWSGSVLARLEDEASAKGRRFAANVFALSSISGGSLGAAAWVAELAQYPTSAPCEGTTASPCRRQRVERFLGGDFLSPVVARMLGPDFAIRFVPFPLPAEWSASADRSLGLEKPWAQDWPKLPESARARQVDWNRPLTELYAAGEPDGVPRLPTLLLNTVRIDDGQRFLQSNVKVGLAGVMDLLADDFDTGRLTLAQAVHNSARFPFISPAAAVLASREPNPAVGRLGDGGYHEASGAATLADLLELLVRQGHLREPIRGKGLWACRAGWKPDAGGGAPACPPTSDGRGGESRIVVMILDGSPAVYPHSHVRNLDGTDLALPLGQSMPDMPLPEVLGPVFGGLSTRSHLSTASQRRLSRLVGDDKSALVELRMPMWRTTIDDEPWLGDADKDLCKDQDDQPSMNWALDTCSRARLRAATAPTTSFRPNPTLAHCSLVNNLTRLRELVGLEVVRNPAADRGLPC